jgi:hypothetical protein
MPYEVIEGAVAHKKKSYLPGDTIEGLSETDVERLLSLGRIRPAATGQPAPADKKPATKSKKTK